MSICGAKLATQVLAEALMQPAEFAAQILPKNKTARAALLVGIAKLSVSDV